MGRERTPEELGELKEQATAMRLAGIGAKRIAKELRISHPLARDLLEDVPVVSALTRPNARDATRAAAELLRADGRTYDEIAEELGVSKSSLSLWLRELPHPTDEQRIGINRPQGVLVAEASDRRGTARILRAAGFVLREIADELQVAPAQAYRWTSDLPVPVRAVHGRPAAEVRAMGRAAWDRRLAADDAERAAFVDAVAASVGPVSDELLDLLATVTYWCEGSKRKPWNRHDRLSLINSDPDVIRLWCEWLRRRGVAPERWRLRVNIHESADVARATRYWADVVRRPVEEFQRPTLKRHNPKTVRKNVGESYHGCLAVNVLQGRVLYREIEGLWRGIVAQALSDTSRIV
jgi:orotate phosphoribosyltransferase-like protein